MFFHVLNFFYTECPRESAFILNIFVKKIYKVLTVQFPSYETATSFHMRMETESSLRNIMFY
jgi:hypothetical protein